MACMKLGSKSDVFLIDGQTWLCSTGLPSDIIVEVGEMSFHLHKFPLLSRSGLLENRIGELSSEDETKCVLQLHDLPGGAKTFLLVVKFCYGVKIELTALNVVSLRCAAEHLRMNEEYGEGNLIRQTENFLNEVFSSWIDSIKALETCEEVLPHAEELHVVSRCINSMVMKACADPALFSWPTSGHSVVHNPDGTILWNGICATSKPNQISDDWWYEDASFLRFPLFKRLIMGVESRGKQERVAGPLMYYVKRHLPLLGRQSNPQNGNRTAPGSSISTSSNADQKSLLEEIVELLPSQKGIMPTKFLLRLLRTSMILHASQSCRENLETRIGDQLDQAELEDLIIPNMGYSFETLYDIDCVQRMLDHFMLTDKDEIDPASNSLADDEQLIEGSHSLTPITMVANLMDGYLAEVAPDVNLKLPKFQSIAAVIPDYARPLDDGIYRAIDIFLKAHPWLTDSEREQLCRLLNCQKLSLEASTHAAQNERLPLRLIVQVLFFEQLRLRTSIAGWFFVSDNLENSNLQSGNLAMTRNDASANHLTLDDLKDRVFEVEKECLSMKQELEKLVKTKGSWNLFLKRLRFGMKSKSSEAKQSKPKNLKESQGSTAQPMKGSENHRSG